MNLPKQRDMFRCSKRGHSMKQCIRLLIIMGVLLLSGCQKEPVSAGEAQTQIQAQTQSEEDAAENETAKVLTIDSNETAKESRALPLELNYCYHNGVEYERVYFQENVDYVKIDGLRNESVQQKINERMKEAAEELYYRDLPPYRGIKVLVSNGEEENLNIQIYAQAYYNESNIYSVLLRKIYRNSDYSVFIEDVIPLSFDLRTGEEITISDLFADGYDYQSVISEYVRTCISENLLDGLLNSNVSEYSSDLTLLQPFDTIEETQKFIISSWNEVYLLLDYENREFDVGTQVRYLPVYAWLLPDKGQEFVFSDKYETWDASLYREGFKRWKSLKVDPDYQREMWISDIPQLENVQFRTYISNNIENQQLSQRFTKSIGQVQERAAGILEENQLISDDDLGGDYSYFVNKYGKYIVESESYSFWSREDYLYDSHDNIYDSITGKKITLGDCFVPGVNYRELIVSLAMAEDSALSREDLVRGLKEPEFMIAPTYFTITFIRMDSSYGLYESSIYVEFRDIGEENLVIFD